MAHHVHESYRGIDQPKVIMYNLQYSIKVLNIVLGMSTTLILNK